MSSGTSTSSPGLTATVTFISPERSPSTGRKRVAIPSVTVTICLTAPSEAMWRTPHCPCPDAACTWRNWKAWACTCTATMRSTRSSISRDRRNFMKSSPAVWRSTAPTRDGTGPCWSRRRTSSRTCRRRSWRRGSSSAVPIFPS